MGQLKYSVFHDHFNVVSKILSETPSLSSMIGQIMFSVDYKTGLVLEIKNEN